jgi:pimeloyl-ACP methyl ester carboxylesterase
MPRGISTVRLANGLTLSYWEQGEPSGSALVLLPGPTDSWRSYQPVLERLPMSIRTISVSQRGHGDSQKPATGYRVEDFAADAVGLFDALRIERAVLAGHSGSCLVARRVALDAPERVAGLVLEASPTTLVGNAGLVEFVESVVSRLEDPIDPDLARSFVVDTSSGEVAPGMLDELVSELLKVPARVWRDVFAGLLQYDDVPELGRIAVPVLLIWGDRDGIVGREMQEQLAARLSCADLGVYHGAGHTPRWEDPSRFAADVTAFVERLLPARP